MSNGDMRSTRGEVVERTPLDDTHSYRRSRQRSSTLKRTTMQGTTALSPWPTHRRCESDCGVRGRSLFRKELEDQARSLLAPPQTSRQSGISNGVASPIIQTTFMKRESSPGTTTSRSAGESRRGRPLSSSTQSSQPSIQVHDAPKHLKEVSHEAAKERIQRTDADVAVAAASWRFPAASSRLSPRGSPASQGHNTTSPDSCPSTCSESSSTKTDCDGEETDHSSSPDWSVDGRDSCGRSSPAKPEGDDSPDDQNAEPRNLQELQELEERISRLHHNRYGTPEMPRGSAYHQTIPPKGLRPRPPNQPYAMHLPRAEKLPLSGYELVAGIISGRDMINGPLGQHYQQPPTQSSHRRRGSSVSVMSASSSNLLAAPPNMDLPPTLLKPIYRRFEQLNHRVLLHLQDELSELEEQLHRLNTADTQTRRVQNQILPASRRAESQAGGELYLQRTEVLSKIGVKLQQYNHAIASFSKIERLPNPSLADVEHYRSFLASDKPIAENETRFLDCDDDLLDLSPPQRVANSSTPPAILVGRGPSSAAMEEQDNVRSQTWDDTLTPMPGQGPLQQGVPTPTFGLRSVPLASRPSSPPGNQQPVQRRASPPGPARSPGLASCYSSAYPLEPSAPTSIMSLLVPAEAKEGGADVTAGPRSSSGVKRIVTGIAGAVLAPVLAFAFIPSFAGRMAVVLLVALLAGVLIGCAQMLGPKTYETLPAAKDGDEREEGVGSSLAVAAVAPVPGIAFSRQDLLFCAGAYGGVMAVIAGTFA